MDKLEYATAAEILGLGQDLDFDPLEQRAIVAKVSNWIANYGEGFVRDKSDVFLCNFANMGLLRLAPGKPDSSPGCNENTGGSS